MAVNWILILNVLFLIGVVAAIIRMMKSRRQQFSQSNSSAPSLGQANHHASDDVIAVRKISSEPMTAFAPAEDEFEPLRPRSEPRAVASDVSFHHAAASPVPEPMPKLHDSPVDTRQNEPGHSLMIFLQAKEKRTLAGYELLQTVLAAGLRFGDGQLFHRHQYPNGQGPVLCSLAAATSTGVFDLQNMGAFSVRGLCLFMHSSGNAGIDEERFQIMLETARQLNCDLDTRLLDDKQKPFSDESLERYCRLLNISVPETMDAPL